MASKGTKVLKHKSPKAHQKFSQKSNTNGKVMIRVIRATPETHAFATGETSLEHPFLWVSVGLLAGAVFLSVVAAVFTILHVI